MAVPGSPGTGQPVAEQHAGCACAQTGQWSVIVFVVRPRTVAMAPRQLAQSCSTPTATACGAHLPPALVAENSLTARVSHCGQAIAAAAAAGALTAGCAARAGA